jgi:hypothetical protein
MTYDSGHNSYKPKNVNRYQVSGKMNQKIICLIIIAMFAFSILPMSIVEAQQLNHFKVTQEIASGTMPLFSDSAEIAYASNFDNIKFAQGKPAPTPKSYALTIEIDYIVGHEPTQSVLDYMVTYYAKQNIQITPILDDAIPLDDSFSNGISDAEFSNLETIYNDGLDSLDADSDYDEYLMPEKWVLYGTTVEGGPDTVGYTHCVGNYRDLVAGNYIYIADKATDDWAPTAGVTPAGAEAVVLMHEFGHSIGICVVRAGGEAYCTNYYCVMSYLRPQNAGNIDSWYYCSNHWKTKNLDYYVV